MVQKSRSPHSDTFTSIKITITPFGIDGNERVSYQVLNAAMSQVAADTVSGNPKEVVIPTPGNGEYFIQIFDDGSLTSASGNGAYGIDAVGVDPNAPPTETNEKEDNNSSAKANELFVPFTLNNTGATVFGKLRENNQPSNPRDEDWFKFTNTHKFSSFKINIFEVSEISGPQAKQIRSYEREIQEEIHEGVQRPGCRPG